MTTQLTAPEPSPSVASLRPEIEAFLTAYGPTSLPPGRWAQIAPDLLDLVRRDGPATRGAAKKDISPGRRR